MPHAMTCLLKDDEISFFLALAERAGKVALEMRESIVISEKTGPNDRVTTADIELSRILVEEISNRYPQDKVVSEEDTERGELTKSGRIWMIDPIDGTDSYIKNDGQYSVMIGLLIDAAPVFGFVYAPSDGISYFGGPGFGAWKLPDGGKPEQFSPLSDIGMQDPMRLMMGFRDRRRHPWIEELPQVKLIKTGSIGIKVARILENRADAFVHMSGKLKTWDTAGPVAIALANDLDVGTMDSNQLTFDLPSLMHETPVIIGRKGSVDWARHYLAPPDGAQ